eukprot:gnl/Chilomastix_cuspidata/710.p4 GENE.gnl/Chilomastix_cuspidata/710~~gnl/Chilomastix_cuspidata/710.p4  ORF type:complete len:263 (+),score=121.42 gnl/Chilomastix_cuspidata/710:1602-2390(+)
MSFAQVVSPSAGAYQATGPSYDQEYQALRSRITLEIRNISMMKSKLERISNELGTPRDTPALREELKRTTLAGNQLETSVKAQLKHLSEMPGSTLDEKKERRLLFNRLTTDFRKHMHELVQTSRTAQSKAQTTAQRASLNDEEREQQRIADQQRLEQIEIDGERVDAQLDYVAATGRQVDELHEDLVEMHSIAQHVNIMVEKQGEDLRYADKQVEEAVDYVDEGVDDIKVAQRYQKKAYKKYWWVGLIVVVVIAIVLLVFLI